MCGAQGGADTAQDMQRLGTLSGNLGGETLAQRVAFEQLHHQERPLMAIDAEVIDTNHMGMREARCGNRLPPNTPPRSSGLGVILANSFTATGRSSTSSTPCVNGPMPPRPSRRRGDSAHSAVVSRGGNVRRRSSSGQTRCPCQSIVHSSRTRREVHRRRVTGP